VRKVRGIISSLLGITRYGVFEGIHCHPNYARSQFIDRSYKSSSLEGIVDNIRSMQKIVD